MKNKRISRIVTACLFSLIIYGCNNAPKQVPGNLQVKRISDEDSVKILEAKWGTLYSQLVSQMRGATIADTIRHIVLMNFSSEIQPDTFALEVSPGLIAASKSELSIKTSDNRVIFSQVFNTIDFARAIIEYHIPYSGGPTGREKIEDLNKQISSFDTVTKTRIEHKVLSSVKVVFNDMYVTNDQLAQAAEVGDINDSALYNEAINPASGLRIIIIPCFDCDEGVSYFAYSAEEKMAKEILASD